MADETTQAENPVDAEQPSNQQPQGAAQAVGSNPTPLDPTTAPQPVKDTQAKTVRELRAERAAPETLPKEGQAAVASESPVAAANREAAEAQLNKPIEAVEDKINAADAMATPFTVEDVTPHAIGDTTNVFGHVVPFNLYDVVFVSLAALTVIEVITGTLLPHIWLTIVVLLVIAAVKAFHVVWFYMHLSMDNRIFWLTLLLPLFIALMGLVYLIAVPSVAYPAF